mgnify:CR=1 FL=1
METRRKIWAIALVLALLTGVAFAQAARADRATTAPATGSADETDITPLERADDGPILPPAEAAPRRTAGGEGDEPAPTVPGEMMSPESRDIYIYVTLQAPVGPDPPDTVEIINKDCTDGSERVEFKATVAPSILGGDYYYVYRDTLPLFFKTQLDTTPANRNLIGKTDIRYFTDDFTGTTELPDTLWNHYWDASKGVCDTLVNLYYTFTTVDVGASAPGGFAESPFPGNALCEYDQAMYSDPTLGGTNWISMPNVDEDYSTASDLAEYGATKISEWEPSSQILEDRGLYNVMFGIWVTDEPLQYGHCYVVFGTDDSISVNNIFQTYKPGFIPDNDKQDTLYFHPTYGGRNIIMLPMKAAIVEDVHDRATLEASIEDAGIGVSARLMRIDQWDCTGFIWNPIAQYNAMFGVWTANPHLKPGGVYRLWLDTGATPTAVDFVWPVG